MDQNENLQLIKGPNDLLSQKITMQYDSHDCLFIFIITHVCSYLLKCVHQKLIYLFVEIGKQTIYRQTNSRMSIEY